MSRINISSNKSSNRGSSILSKGYLLLYNGVQFAGWSYLLYQVGKHYATGHDINTLYNIARPSLMIFQNAALLEVFHAALGLVKSNTLVTALQVASRVMMVLGVLEVTPTARLSPGLPLLLVAWSISEITRYLFYTINLVSPVPHFVLWCRYTFFYLLYPIGVSGELLCLYAAQAYVLKTKLFTMELPNAANFSFSYHYFLVAVMLSYIPLFPKMYLHMVSQRRKVIGSGSGKKQQ